MSEWTVGTLKEFVEQRFADQEKAVAAALAAAKDAVAAALASAEKAVLKAEESQIAYNVRSNEFREAMDDQSKTMLPRTEADARFQQLRELITTNADQIEALRRGESRVAGVGEAQIRSRTQANWLIGLIVMVGLNFLGLIVGLIYFLTKVK